MNISRIPTRALKGLAAAALCLVSTRCASESGSGMLLQPGGSIDAAIFGDSPKLEVSNEGKGSVTVVMIEGGQETDREELSPGETIMRNLTGGGSALVVNDSREDTFVRVKGLGGTGFKMSGKNPPAGQ